MDGPTAKLAGIDRISGNPEDAPWRAVASEILLDLARSGDPFTSEDITSRAGQPPHPNSSGALLSGAARRGWIRRVGFQGAERANQHAALLSTWIGIPAALPGAAPARVSPLRPGAEPLALSSWSCGSCRVALAEWDVQYLTPSLSPSVRMGRCPSCGKRGPFTQAAR